MCVSSFIPSQCTVIGQFNPTASSMLPALTIRIAGAFSKSENKDPPHFPQNERTTLLPLSPGLLNVVGVPVTLILSAATITFTEKAAPDVFWQFLQWL